jgi:hypothetical protein
MHLAEALQLTSMLKTQNEGCHYLLSMVLLCHTDSPLERKDQAIAFLSLVPNPVSLSPTNMQHSTVIEITHEGEVRGLSSVSKYIWITAHTNAQQHGR